MPTYSVLSGTRYTVQARNTDEAEAKLQAFWFGLDCPCGRPQWAEAIGRELNKYGRAHELCTCVEKDEVDTDIQILHVDGHPEA